MSETDPDLDDINVLIDFEHKVTFIRLVDNLLLPSNLKITAEVLPSILSEDNDQDFEIAFAKIRFWFDNIVSRCIVFCRENESGAALLLDDQGRNISGNTLMLVPEEPTDHHMAALFQAKMTALAGGNLGFGTVQVRSDNVAGLLFTFVGEAEDILPSMDEWVLGGRSYFDKPWWSRDDASTLDVVPHADADITKTPDWAYSLDFIEKAVKPAQDIVLRGNFKPNIIDGGKRE